MADHPPNFWIEPGLAQHVVCGTDHAVVQALAAGCDRRRVHRVQGMILRPEFHLPSTFDRAAERERLGLEATAPVGLVLFGGTGSRVMKRIAASLPDTPLILMCGRNVALADSLRKMPARAPRFVVGYTSEVARWMRLADFFIGKPGPGSLSEAVQLGLPVIVTRNAATMPQERWNAHWVREHGLGVVLRSFATVSGAVDEIVADLPARRARALAMHNRAVYELPEVLARLLAEGAAAGAGAAPRAIQVATA